MPVSKKGNRKTDKKARERRASGMVTPTREQIERRAYELYLARGGGQGHESDDWLQAERELLERRKGTGERDGEETK